MTAASLVPHELLRDGADVFWHTGADWVLLDVSENVRRVMGIGSDVLLGRRMVELLPPGCDPLQLLDGLTTPSQRFAGGPRYFEHRGVPLHDAGGACIGYAGVSRDVTARVQMEGALADAEQRARMIAELASDVVLQADPEGRLVWVSPAVRELLGREPGDMVGRPVFEFIHPDDLLVSHEAGRAINDGASVVSMEVRQLRADGGYVWSSVTLRPLHGPDGAIVGRVAGWRSIDGARRAREELEASEARYRMLAEHASDVVAHLDASGVVLWVSPSATTALGWNADEIIGRTADWVFHPDDMPVLRAARESAARGESGRFSARMLRKDGTYMWASAAGSAVVDADGTVIGRIASWRDIDEEHHIREELEHREAQYRLLLDSVAEIVVHQVDGIPVFISPSVTRVLGWTVEEFLGHPATDYWHPDDHEKVFALRRLAYTGGSASDVMRMAHKEGGYRWLEASLRSTSLPDGRTGAVGVMRDVTARVEAEQQLRTAAERDRMMAELGSDMLLITDRHGTIEQAVGAAQRLLGVAPDVLVGRSAMAFFGAEMDDTRAERTERMRRGETISGYVYIRRPDGDHRWIHRRTKAIIGDDGRIEHLATSWRDAQAEMEYQDRLVESERAALDASQAKTIFLSRMSHELRTPLNAVIGFAQLLGMDALTEEQRAEVEQILRGGRHLLRLINEVLDISRIEAGRMSLSPESVLVGDVVSEALELVRTLAQQQRVQIGRFDVNDCGQYAFVDRQRVIQILINLLGNAVKYNKPGGSVTVRCRQGGAGEVCIDVVDTGIGIAEDDLAKVFEPFERLGAAASDVEGAGIGLALSQALAQLLHGRLEATSVLGEGSTFTLVIPMASRPSAEAAGQLTSDVRLSHRHNVSVLYVEDNPANAALMESIAARRPGVQLTTIRTGRGALDHLTAHLPDLVMLDLHLADISGEEVLASIRSDDRMTNVPVVVISADAGRDVRSRVIASGATAYLTKPVDVHDVLTWLDDPERGGSR